jgi:hypothetical protein
MKFKSILFPFGEQSTESAQSPGTVTLRGPKWCVYTCTIDFDSTFRDLGLIYNTKFNGNSQYEVTIQRLSVSLNALRYKVLGCWGTEYVMKSVVMAQVAYSDQGGLLSDAHLQKLDSVILPHARQALQKLSGFPSTPLTPSADWVPYSQHRIPRSQAKTISASTCERRQTSRGRPTTHDTPRNLSAVYRITLESDFIDDTPT